MSIEIKIDPERCKGCKLCIWSCPKDVLKVLKKSNNNGYFPVQQVNKENCTGCGYCHTICPEGIVEIYKEKD